MKISACYITKNEEKVLDRSLRSLCHQVDEIIVVDTGSTDRTKEIAAGYGARIYDFHWQGDFAAARNEAIRYATGDWIIFLDADESFAGNVSGESMKYKLMGLDNMTSVKEAKFRKGLMRRIELICNYLRTTDSSLQFDFIDIEPVFTRNRPVNELEIAQMMQTLTGILSEETIIGMFPSISDPQAELKKKQDENESVFEQPYEMQQEETAEVGEEDVQE